VLTVTAKNVGDQPEPMGIGWHPRFQILSNRREDVEVRLPAGDQLEIADATKGMPTGRLVDPTSRMARFQGRGDALGAEGIDESVVNSKKGSLDAGAAAEMRDPGSDFGLRLTALSSTIRAIRVTSPSGSNYVSLGAQTNYDDPLGKEWGVGDTPAIVTLQPGQSVMWKVKLEIFPLAKK
jgi:galactose mutarotase-like enzyme